MRYVGSKLHVNYLNRKAQILVIMENENNQMYILVANWLWCEAHLESHRSWRWRIFRQREALKALAATLLLSHIHDPCHREYNKQQQRVFTCTSTIHALQRTILRKVLPSWVSRLVHGVRHWFYTIEHFKNSSRYIATSIVWCSFIATCWSGIIGKRHLR